MIPPILARRVLACLLAAGLGSACGAWRPAQAPRPVVIAVPSAPISLLPNCANEDFTLSMLSNSFETLVEFDPGLTLREGLAESWYTHDDSTWVFRLRKGVLRHDGRPFTAADAAAAIEHARSAADSRRRPQLAPIQSLEAPDPLTLIVRTRGRFDPLPMRLANIMIWARDARGEPVGTGPFRLSAAEASPQRLVLTAFPEHRGGAPALPGLVFETIPDPAQRVAAVLSGAADFMIDVPAPEMRRLANHRHLTTRAVSGLRVFFVVFDVRKPPFSDPRVRRALALATDKPALVDATGGYASPVDQIVSPEELGGQQLPIEGARHDLAAARALLDEAGGGFETTFSISPKYRGMREAAEALAAQWSQVGVRARVQVVPVAEFFAQVERGDMPLYALGWISDSGDGRVSYEYLLHTRTGDYGLNNGGGYSDPELDGLIESAARTAKKMELARIFSLLAQKVVADVPVLPLYRQSDLYAWSHDLEYTPRLDRRLKFGATRWRAR